MTKQFVIQWKSKANGRSGKGTKVFSEQEVQELVQELNAEYPDIEHEALLVNCTPSPIAAESELAATPPVAAPEPVQLSEVAAVPAEVVPSAAPSL